MFSAPPDALLFITSDCLHCPGVLQALSELVKLGLVGQMTVVNAAVHPEQAAQHGVRTAPWLRLGPFTLTGAQTPLELRQWAVWSRGDDGIAHYVDHLLTEGNYQQAKAFVEADARRLAPLLTIVADPAARIAVRLGVSALLEAYTNAPELRALLPQLTELSRHPDHRVRADACHLLGLTGSPAARDPVAVCLHDEHEEVREIAEDAMEELETAE